jgi:hypothetical protein
MEGAASLVRPIHSFAKCPFRVAGSVARAPCGAGRELGRHYKGRFKTPASILQRFITVRTGMACRFN